MASNLIVDLDHTLIDIDLLQLSSKIALKQNPLLIFIMPFWLIQGKGFLKDKLVQRVAIDVSKLPYNKIVIEYIKKRKINGDSIVLATASHKYYANQVAEYLKIFDKVMASDKEFNLSSYNKASKLVKVFGKKNFDYIGDHMRDIPVWSVSDLTIIAPNVSSKVLRNTVNFNRFLLS